MEAFIPFIFIFLVIYFIMIRPQLKRTKEEKEAMRESIVNMKKGDWIKILMIPVFLIAVNKWLPNYSFLILAIFIPVVLYFLIKNKKKSTAELSVSTAELSVIRGILIVGIIAGTLFTTVGVLGWASMEVEPTTQKILDEGIVDFFRGPWDDIDGMLRSQKIKYETKKKKFENFFYIGIGVLVICALGFFKIQKKVVESKAKDFESKKDDLLEKF